ncbi:hypothetical protein [Noviherbaspirillum sp. Root189]|uniref:hypothetical protein n=1 Tax=Noviherbaspirillum sp. Root189 TaxID=1736487 RepID=UPI00070DDEAF|nr:hypothetical protein [Noviherbaspirillum sp. Root189]KRB84962.1 hypothetical protein ASE07_22240 [Noviherbaspirillum sp. Root189]
MILSDLPLWLAIVSLVVVAAVCIEVGIGWRRIAHLKDMPPADGEALPRVSIIVSALNEADTLARQGIDWRGTRYPLKNLRRAHNKEAPKR